MMLRRRTFEKFKSFNAKPSFDVGNDAFYILVLIDRVMPVQLYFADIA